MRKDRYTPPVGFCAPHVIAALPADTPVAVAFSGGADSVALLHILSKTHQGPLYALHVHHGIRAGEADRDAEFCRTFCDTLGIPFACIRVDVPALAEQSGESLETAARTARYAALCEQMRSLDIDLLVTAHHADDQLETVLHHLLRGSGLRGLCGIPQCRKMAHGTVVRPLLQLTKAQILDYCTDHGLSFVTDSTNEQPCCARNQLRLEVVPLLRSLWPSGAKEAARCALSLAEDERYLTELAEHFLAAEGDRPTVSALAPLPGPIFARVMRLLLPEPPEAVHIDALRTLLQSARPHASLSLPGATVALENGRLCVQTEEDLSTPVYEIALRRGQTPLPCGLAVFGTPEEILGVQNPGFAHEARISLSANAERSALTLRTRRPGERILHGGHHKLVRKLYCMAGFSKAERSRMPLLCDTEGVLAVPFGPVRDNAGGKDLALLLFFN